MFNKKILFITLALALTTCVVGCGEKNDNKKDASKKSEQSTKKSDDEQEDLPTEFTKEFCPDEHEWHPIFDICVHCGFNIDDYMSFATIKTAFDTATAQDDIYNEIISNSTSSNNSISIYFNDDTLHIDSKANLDLLSKEMSIILEDLRAPKSKGAKGYSVSWIITDMGEINDVKVNCILEDGTIY